MGTCQNVCDADFYSCKAKNSLGRFVERNLGGYSITQ